MPESNAYSCTSISVLYPDPHSSGSCIRVWNVDPDPEGKKSAEIERGNETRRQRIYH
jgi:hypothetical protein